MYEVIFDINGAKAFVKNLRVLSQRTIRETVCFIHRRRTVIKAEVTDWQPTATTDSRHLTIEATISRQLRVGNRQQATESWQLTVGNRQQAKTADI
jgi:hypothetical protein